MVYCVKQREIRETPFLINDQFRVFSHGVISAIEGGRGTSKSIEKSILRIVWSVAAERERERERETRTII